MSEQADIAETPTPDHIERLAEQIEGRPLTQRELEGMCALLWDQA